MIAEVLLEASLRESKREKSGWNLSKRFCGNADGPIQCTPDKEGSEEVPPNTHTHIANVKKADMQMRTIQMIGFQDWL